MATIRKLGKQPQRVDPRTLKLGKYLSALLPAPPTRVDWTRGFNINWGMMLNDSLGDCTEAAKAHAIQIWSLCNGRLATLPDSVVLAAYESECGYVLGNPSTDNGGVELNVLNDFRKNGLGDHQLSSFVSLDQFNLAHIQTGIYLFGLAYIGFSVPQSAMDQNAAGQVWDCVPNDGGIVGGHAVIIPAYDASQNMFTAITWGEKQLMTWRFWQKYVDEAYVLLSPDWLGTRGIDPSGFDLASLQADLAAVTG